jgi:hypothetical protein
MSRLPHAMCLVGVGLFLSSCQNKTNVPADTYEIVRHLDQVDFTMVALRSGSTFAYNQSIHDGAVPTRYSDQISKLIRPLLDKLPENCRFAGFAGSVSGDLVRAVRQRSLRLDINDLADIRPLQEVERQQFRGLSPAIRGETIC